MLIKNWIAHGQLGSYFIAFCSSTRHWIPGECVSGSQRNRRKGEGKITAKKTLIPNAALFLGCKLSNMTCHWNQRKKWNQKMGKPASELGERVERKEKRGFCTHFWSCLIIHPTFSPPSPSSCLCLCHFANLFLHHLDLLFIPLSFFFLTRNLVEDHEKEQAQEQEEKCTSLTFLKSLPPSLAFALPQCVWVTTLSLDLQFDVLLPFCLFVVFSCVDDKLI